MTDLGPNNPRTETPSQPTPKRRTPFTGRRPAPLDDPPSGSLNGAAPAPPPSMRMLPGGRPPRTRTAAPDIDPSDIEPVLDPVAQAVAATRAQQAQERAMDAHMDAARARLEREHPLSDAGRAELAHPTPWRSPRQQRADEERARNALNDEVLRRLGPPTPEQIQAAREIGAELAEGEAIDFLHFRDTFARADDFLAAHPEDDAVPDAPRLDVRVPHVSLVAAAWDAALRANVATPLFFTQGTEAVRLTRDPSNLPVLRMVTQTLLRHALHRWAVWFTVIENRNSQREKRVAPPEPVVSDMQAREPLWPPLRRIIEAPAFAADGTLQTTPGYSPHSKNYYVAAPGLVIPPVSQQPSAEEIARARDLFCVELFGDFPFTGPAERANLTALALQPFARDLILGATPLYTIEAPGPGTGKTLAAEIALWPAYGRAVESMSEAQEPEEWRKRITAALIGGTSCIFLDNLRQRIDSAALAQTLTATSAKDRWLGKSEILRFENWATWVATANNPTYSDEMLRRAVRIRLDARIAQPWRRPKESFRHPGEDALRAWATAHRGDLLWAGLTLLQAWLVAGRPRGTAVKGMFQGWADVLGGVLDVAGVPGFLTNEADFTATASTEEAGEWAAFLATWATQYPGRSVGVRDLWPVVKAGDHALDLGEGSERGQRTRLGQEIQARRDKPIGHYRIKVTRTVQGAQQWRVERIEQRRRQAAE